MSYYINPLLYFHSTDLEKNFVFNGLNGAVDILNRNLAIYLSNNRGKCVEVTFEEVESLMERNYVFRNQNDYQELRSRIESYHHELLKNEPYHISILPTFECNLSCPYCFEYTTPTITRDNKEYLECIIRALRYFSGKGTIIPELYGGEPLLPENSNILEGILEECKKLNIKNIGVITNGVHLREFSHVVTHYTEIGFNFQITIDGPPHIHNQRRVSDEIKDSFTLIMEGIESVIEKSNVFIQIRTNADKHNAKYLSELYLYFEEKFAFYNNVLYYLTPTSNRHKEELDITEADMIQLIESLPKIQGLKKGGGLHFLSYLYSLIDANEGALPMYSYCEGVRGKYFALAPDGNIYSCGEAVGISKHSVGRFDSYGVEIDDEKLQKWIANTIVSRSDCQNCPLCFLCGGGCALDNFMQTGKYDGRVVCNKVYKNVKEFFDYLYKRTF